MKNICILYHGQLRTFKKAVIFHKKNLFVQNKDYKYHVIFSTWVNECVIDFQTEYKNSYIKQEACPERSELCWDDRFKPHNSNPQLNGDIFPFYCQMKLWKNALDALNEYETSHNINFDLIIRLRPDTYFTSFHDFSNEYKFYFDNIKLNNVYVPEERRFDVYKTGSVPDQICFGNKDVITKILLSINIVTDVQQEPFVIHPETSLHNIMKYYDMNIIYLKFEINNDWWTI